MAGNSEATDFWRRAIPSEFAEDENQHGTTQRFDI